MEEFLSVAPFVGVWIEIFILYHIYIVLQQVAPFVGVWIEILTD